jgi:hypothetical protein
MQHFVYQQILWQVRGAASYVIFLILVVYQQDWYHAFDLSLFLISNFPFPPWY